MNADPNGYLMRFADGPLAARSNVDTIESKLAGGGGAAGNMVIKRDVFGWPLPDELGVLCHEGVDETAFWNAADPVESGLPPELYNSPNAIVYVKVSESKLTDDSMSHVMRGAEYRLKKQEGTVMDNPNEYDDDSYTRASNDAIGGVGGMWEAGASVDDIEATVRDALEGVVSGKVTVDIEIAS